MDRTPPRPPPQDEAQIDAEINEGGPTPLERTAERTHHTVHAPKPEAPRTKPKKKRER